MTDLTKITTPFGLLDAETQEALRAHGGPYEWYHGAKRGWLDDPNPQHTFYKGSLTIRVKPQPPKPREWWIVGGCEAWDTEEAARDNATFGASIIHVREVLSDD